MKRQATEGVGVGNAVAAAGAEAHARCGEGWQWAQLEAKQRGCTKLQISPTVYSFLSTFSQVKKPASVRGPMQLNTPTRASSQLGVALIVWTWKKPGERPMAV